MALLVSKDVALERLTRLQQQLEAGSASGRTSAEDYAQLVYEWQSVVGSVVAQGHQLHSALARATHSFLGLSGDVEGSKSRGSVVKAQARLVERFIDQVRRDDVTVQASAGPTARTAIEQVLHLLVGFHRVVKQLRHRYDDRETLKVDDEHDAQDLLHALLRIDFKDVRAEEWTPSYAGNSSRMDFLLKAEKLVIELKMTRPGLGNKEATNQLAVDIERYRAHPDCKTLVCFVYDPAELITNPAALEHDLSGPRGELVVKVVVLSR